MTAQEFELEDTDGTYSFVVRCAWSEQVAALAARHRVSHLELNYAKGWKGADVAFLRALPWLRSLKIIDWHLDDIAPVLSLTELRRLYLGTHARTKMDYAVLPHLTEASLEWGPGAATIFSCAGLESLFLNHYDGVDARAMSHLESLTKLSLASPALRTLTGLPKNLSFLGLYNAKRLADLEGVSALSRLTQLEINGCRNLGGIDAIGALTSLSELQLCDDGHIASLQPLGRLSELRVFLFYGTTNIVDGDLTPLTLLPQLRRVVFADRRHYSHRVSDLTAQLDARANP